MSNTSIVQDMALGASTALPAAEGRAQVVVLGDLNGNVLKTVNNNDGTSTLDVASAGGTQTVTGTVTANQGTAAATASAWPAKIVDSAGVNVAAVSAAGAVKVDGSAASVPAAANVLVGTVATDTGTIITIPLGRTWVGQILLSGAVTVAGGATGGVNATPNVTVVGTGSPTPATTTKIAQLAVSVPANLTGSLNGTNANDTATINAVVYAGTASATLQLNFGSATAASASAVGALQ